LSLRYRLILILSFAALLPLLFAGWMTSQVANREATERSEVARESQARELAAVAEIWMTDRLRGIQLAAGFWSLDRLDAGARDGFLRLVYNQFEAVNAVALLSAEGGLEGEAVRLLAAPDPLSEWAGHQAVSDERLAAFLAAIPLGEVTPGEAALGDPYAPPGGGAAVVPVALSVPGGILAVELSLDWLARHFLVPPGEGRSITLIDAAGEILAGSPTTLVDLTAFADIGGDTRGQLRTELPDGTAVHASFVPVGDTGWNVVVADSRAAIERAGREIRDKMFFFFVVAGVLASVLGVLGALQLEGPVVQLKDAALAVAEGDFGRRVTPGGSRELAELARAFNFMSSRLRRDKEEIQKKNQEIEAFNRDLQRRVEERTRELREAQDRLVESARMAAVAHMGAGLAHELNNPVAGILGMIQLAIARAASGPIQAMLRTVEGQAQRCREILAALTRLTGEGPAERTRLELGGLVESVLGLTGGALLERGVNIHHSQGVEVWVEADPARMGQALTHLLKSLATRLGAEGAITIRPEAAGGEVALHFELSGVDAEARDDWLASGMGFWVARQELERHGGRLEQVAPSRWRLVLPAA